MLRPVYGSQSSSSFATRKGHALSKQRLSHWVVDAISHAYGASGRPPAIRDEMPLYEEHLNILGCPERGAPGDHLRRGVVGVFRHILQVLPGQCRHSPSFGRGPVAELRCFQLGK